MSDTIELRSEGSRLPGHPLDHQGPRPVASQDLTSQESRLAEIYGAGQFFRRAGSAGSSHRLRGQGCPVRPWLPGPQRTENPLVAGRRIVRKSADAFQEALTLRPRRWDSCPAFWLRQGDKRSLETFRKDGTVVKTPIWFACEGDALYFWTQADSYKVKRLRINPKVRFAVCKRFGEVTGEWMTGEASVDESQATVEHVEALLCKKIGFGFTLFRCIDRIRDRLKGSRRVALKVRLT